MRDGDFRRGRRPDEKETFPGAVQFGERRITAEGFRDYRNRAWGNIDARFSEETCARASRVRHQRRRAGAGRMADGAAVLPRGNVSGSRSVQKAGRITGANGSEAFHGRELFLLPGYGAGIFRRDYASAWRGGSYAANGESLAAHHL